ncbi:MAG: RNA polymerase sigma factor [Planctomycetota bacterium]
MAGEEEIAGAELGSGEARPELPPALRARLPAREEAALGAFFDLYFPRVHGLVRRLVGDEHLAEDLTQDVFLQVYRALPGYDPARPLRPWVFAIATNRIRDHWRSRRHQDAAREAPIDGEEESELAALLPAPDVGLLAGEAAAAVRQAVDALPEGIRVTVLLRAFEGLSFGAIGAMLALEEPAVRKRYSRGLGLLRAALGPLLGPEGGHSFPAPGGARRVTGGGDPP